eukprot:TRINITY_DN1795_c0_g1_i2.p1 TRINITY_DN1795_c0_g1~~TRINITY_DN1795_c0_g1_i2.p1  ORF type:complete len:198 (+),score=73.43 TRINITY_DN1795_c0_g1_i2:362-955(+)
MIEVTNKIQALKKERFEMMSEREQAEAKLEEAQQGLDQLMISMQSLELSKKGWETEVLEAQKELGEVKDDEQKEIVQARLDQAKGCVKNYVDQLERAAGMIKEANGQIHDAELTIDRLREEARKQRKEQKEREEKELEARVMMQQLQITVEESISNSGGDEKEVEQWPRGQSPTPYPEGDDRTTESRMAEDMKGQTK